MNQLVKQAFTLIELLVVIAIIGILSGLIVVGLSGMTQKANIAKAQLFSNSLRNSLMLNLVSEWKFDGTSSDGSSAIASDVLDTWSGSNNGTLSATPPIVRTGFNCVSSSCLQFDGSTNFVYFGNKSNLSMGTGNATVSLWAYFNNATPSHYETLAECGDANGATQAGYHIMRPSGSNYLLLAFSDGTGEVSASLSPSGSLIANTWYNIVVVFNRTSVAQAYINGTVQAGYSDNISSKQGNVQNYDTFRIGGYDLGYGNLAGKMDEVRIYNAALPTSQIKEQYYAGLNSLLANGNITSKEYAERINSIARQ